MRLTTYEPVEGGIPYVTVKDEQDALQKLAAYEDAGLEPEQIKDLNNGIIPEHWAELFKAECEGRLIVLPCKVGDTVYRICHEYKQGNPFIRAVEFSQHNFWRIVFGGEFGKTVFLTREEAEAALKKMVTDSNQVKEEEE